MTDPIPDSAGRIERLERTVRRQNLLIGVLLGGALFAVLGGATRAPEEMTLPAGTIMGLAVDDDVIYRITAGGEVEQIAIGERRTALVELQIAEPRRAVPGIRWEPILQQRP